MLWAGAPFCGLMDSPLFKTPESAQNKALIHLHLTYHNMQIITNSVNKEQAKIKHLSDINQKVFFTEQ